MTLFKSSFLSEPFLSVRVEYQPPFLSGFSLSRLLEFILNTKCNWWVESISLLFHMKFSSNTTFKKSLLS